MPEPEWNKVELENGCRFTQLMYLPYFDCIKIDPMYNLLLGNAKRILQTQWGLTVRIQMLFKRG